MSITSQINELNSEFKNFPKNLKITTATITCKVPSVIFNIENIGLYFNDFDDVLVGKKYGNRKDKKKTDESTESFIKINLEDDKKITILDNDENITNKIIIEPNENKAEDGENEIIISKQEKKIEEEENEMIIDKQETKIEEEENKMIIDEQEKKIEEEKNQEKKPRKTRTPKIVSEKKSKGKGNNFYNQVSLIFRTSKLMGIKDEDLSKKDKDKNINVKLFINGSIHMTGCKHFSNIIKVLEIIFEKIVKVKSHYDKNNKCFKIVRFVNSYNPNEVNKKKKEYQEKNKKINQDKFLTKIYEELKLGNIDKLSLSNVKKFKIGMINTNFNIGFKINREVLCKKIACIHYSTSFNR